MLVHLAQAVIYLSLAPKSNSSYIAYERAKKDALHTAAEPVPLTIRNAATRLMKDLGYGQGYRLAHYEADKVAADMQCLPDSLVGATYYAPTTEGHEARMSERLEQLRGLREKAGRTTRGTAQRSTPTPRSGSPDAEEPS